MADMAEGAATGSAEPYNEAVATAGLFLLITAIITLAFSLASWDSCAVRRRGADHVRHQHQLLHISGNRGQHGVTA